MSYLNPPPAPAPVIVTKDVGGIVRDYQAQTLLYRITDREVRIHECHSACTLALSLPNVCVYPDSLFKFHQAYNMNTHVTDPGVSDELMATYPAAVQARLGTLTRQFKVLRGTELIALGIRDCNAPRIMLAHTRPAPEEGSDALAGTITSVMSIFGGKPQPQPERGAGATLVATRQNSQSALPSEALAHVPLPPPRPEFDTPLLAQSAKNLAFHLDAPPPVQRVEAPPPLPTSLSGKVVQALPQIALPKVIQGAQPILPPKFLAYAIIARAQPFGQP